MSIDVVSGWTGRLEWKLKKDGVSADLTGLTVTAYVKDRTNTYISTTCAGAVDVITTTCGHVGYNPNSTSFDAAKSPYEIRFRVVDLVGSKVFYPSGAGERITVRSL
jgi:hypothetical protein